MKRVTFLVIVITILQLWCVPKIYAQACPACSNPALQSSEKLEAGLDTLHKGAFRITLNATNGFNYRGGHPNQRGLSPDGRVIEVPLHDHQVNLDFLRTELALEYTFASNWAVWLRLPYDIKMQTASVAFVNPVTEYEKEAILRNRDIHHRTENYTGISDLRLLAARRFIGFLSPKGRLDLAFGTSLPIGKTEQNPLLLGREGKKHLHIQFGTGTFDPLLELHYAMGVSNQLSFAFYTINKISLYRNSKTYQGPFETTTGFSFGYKATNRLTPRLTFANFSQSQAKWNGEKDPNSGLVSWSLTGSLTVRFKNGLTLTPGYRYPVAQKALSGDGDTFKYGPTFTLNVSFMFNNAN
ncbi:MAG: hypothetical protein GC171_05865 [Terrimonas sp.]|nr:hypothetical protein [Terrimonas sp.]